MANMVGGWFLTVSCQSFGGCSGVDQNREGFFNHQQDGLEDQLCAFGTGITSNHNLAFSVSDLTPSLLTY